MKHILTLFSLLCITSSVFAQTPGTPPPGMPGQGMPPPMRMGGTMPQPVVLKSSYPDSTAFNEEFKQLYPLIKPTPSITERAEMILAHSGNLYHNQGVDSVKARDSVMARLNPHMDDTLLYRAYRAQFTAEELKPIIAFFKTPAGKHFLEVESYTMSARTGQIDQYVKSNVHNVLSKMAKPVEMPNGMRKPPAPGSMPPGMMPPGSMPPGATSTGMPQPPTPPTPPVPPVKN
jgi:hypothetical protein